MHLLKKWKLALMRRRLQGLEVYAEYWRNEQRRLALEAYNVQDHMTEPLRWGRLQNAANWAGHYSRKYYAEARALRHEIKSMTDQELK